MPIKWTKKMNKENPYRVNITTLKGKHLIFRYKNKAEADEHIASWTKKKMIKKAHHLGNAKPIKRRKPGKSNPFGFGKFDLNFKF